MTACEIKKDANCLLETRCQSMEQSQGTILMDDDGDNPYMTSSESSPTSSSPATGVARSVYKHAIALFGSLLVFIGAFLAIVFFPPFFSQDIAANRTYMTVLVIAGIVVGALVAYLSYRATLRTYRDKQR